MKLSSKDDDFRVVGIWGMAGIGKTTLAFVLYDRISYQFDACCFIENVSKIYKDGGATAVQMQDPSHNNYIDVEWYFGVLITLYYIHKLLSSHGIRPAYEMLERKLKQGFFAKYMSKNEDILKARQLMHQAPNCPKC